MNNNQESSLLIFVSNYLSPIYKCIKYDKWIEILIGIYIIFCLLHFTLNKVFNKLQKDKPQQPPLQNSNDDILKQQKQQISGIKISIKQLAENRIESQLMEELSKEEQTMAEIQQNFQIFFNSYTKFQQELTETLATIKKRINLKHQNSISSIHRADLDSLQKQQDSSQTDSLRQSVISHQEYMNQSKKQLRGKISGQEIQQQTKRMPRINSDEQFQHHDTMKKK